MATTPRPNDPAGAAPWWRCPRALVELFAASNLAFLAVDITSAHAVNQFARPAEWVPLAYSISAPVLLALSWLIAGAVAPIASAGRRSGGQSLADGIGHAVGWAGVVVGVAGTIYHMESHFFREQTLHNLVYTAPFAAPLSYAGLGMIVILNRVERARPLEWARWIVLLAMGGFLGNFALSLADHAQNGFFEPLEWVAVASAAYAAGALLAASAFMSSRATRLFAAAVMAAQVIVGLLGFVGHLLPNLRSPMPTLWEKFVYGAPIFAPLLYADLAVLAGLGLWAIARSMPAADPKVDGGLAPIGPN